MACVENQVVDIGISPMKQESELENSDCDNPTSTQSSNKTESNHKILKYTIPKLLVDECSPNKWEPQIAEYISNSIQTSPGASSDRSPNSYVTAKEKLTPLPSADFSFGNSEENTSTNQNHESSFCTNSSVGGEPFVNALSSSSSTESDSTVTLNSESSPVSILNNIDNSPGNSPPEENSSSTPSVKVTYPHRVTFPSDDLSLTQSINSSQQRDSTEPFGESDEDYFEEYHLPNTHENAFVRHLSFRRKVQTTPINAPDAERIEGLVRTGEFIRHGSIRRKIVPEEEVVEEEYEDDDDIYNENEDKNSSSFTDRIERDIHEIERYLSGENVNEYSSIGKCTPGNIKHIKRTASTPKAGNGLNVDNFKSDLSLNAGIEPSNIFEENVSIEESTLRKIQECLDFSAYKDILNFSGRISDLLSPKEVEEVLNNSERYRQYLNTEVIEALSLSYQEQSHSLPCTINFQSNSGSANSNSKSGSKSNKLSNDDNGMSFINIPKSEVNGFPRSNSQNELHLVERNVGACDGIGARGIFVESLGPTTDLKKIPAPEINLDWSSESKYEDGDLETSDRQYLENNPPKKKISVTKDILDFTEYPQDIDLASEAIEKDLERYKQRNISQTTLESETEIPPLNLSSIPPLNLSSIPPPPDLIPELTAAEEMSEVRHWRNVVIGGAWRRIDMKAIAPFRKCISHGGYMDDNSQSPIVVISAALLPDRTRKDYDYVMDNLFMYVLSFLEQLVADDYVLIYFSGGKQNGSGGPGFHWMRRAYEMIDRRLRKNLKSLLVVHPSLWARTILTLSRPFISSKFYRKLIFVHHLTDLAMMVPLEQLEIPDAVKQADFQIMIKEKKKIMNR